jgi:hypothetical protein
VHTDGIAQNILGQTHCSLIQQLETHLQDSLSFSPPRTTTTTLTDPKHGNNQPVIHNNNNNYYYYNTKQQRHNNRGPETWLNLSGIQELVANSNNLLSTPHIVVVPTPCTLANITIFAWSMPGKPERCLCRRGCCVVVVVSFFFVVDAFCSWRQTKNEGILDVGAP